MCQKNQPSYLLFVHFGLYNLYIRYVPYNKKMKMETSFVSRRFSLNIKNQRFHVENTEPYNFPFFFNLMKA